MVCPIFNGALVVMKDSKEMKRIFIKNLMDLSPEERMAWVSLISKYTERDREARREAAKRRGKRIRSGKENTYDLRKAVMRNPYIAFDMLDGVISYRKKEKRHWSIAVDGHCYCRSCGRPCKNKPAPDCTEPRHLEVYQRRVERERRKRNMHR